MPDELGRFLACDELCGTWEPSGDRADRWYRRPRESDHCSRAAGRLHARRTWQPGQSRHHRRRSRLWARSPALPDPGPGHRRERSWPKPAISRSGARVRPQGPARRIPGAGSPAPRNAADAIDLGERSPAHGSAQHVVPRTRSAATATRLDEPQPRRACGRRDRCRCKHRAHRSHIQALTPTSADHHRAHERDFDGAHVPIAVITPLAACRRELAARQVRARGCGLTDRGEPSMMRGGLGPRRCIDALAWPQVPEDRSCQRSVMCIH